MRLLPPFPPVEHESDITSHLISIANYALTMAPSLGSSYSSAASADAHHHHHSHHRSSSSKRRDSSRRRPALPRASTVASITTSNASRKELAVSPKATDLLNRVVLNAGPSSPLRSPVFDGPTGHMPTSPYSRTEEDFLEALEHMRHNSEKSDPSHYFSFPSLELYEDADQQEAGKRDST